jgi:hypothetical protein
MLFPSSLFLSLVGLPYSPFILTMPFFYLFLYFSHPDYKNLFSDIHFIIYMCVLSLLVVVYLMLYSFCALFF